MVYSTSRCPSCGQIIRKQTNPVHEIGNPFERCRWCNAIYRNSYKEEWITKSPIKRFFFFLQAGVWARAFMIPMLLLIIPIAAFDMETDAVFKIWPVLSLMWLVFGFFIYKKASKEDIAASLNRTRNAQYLDALKRAGYSIYPIEDYDLELEQTPKQKNNTSKEKSYSPEEMAGAMAEIGVYEMIAISEILDNKNIRYNDRNIVVETFAYFYAVWMVNWRGLSREQQKEIWHTYEKKFSLFNRKYYEGSTEKIITDNERVLRSKMTCLVQRVSKSYDVKTGTFYDDGISDEYLADILIDENDAEVVKAEIVVRILRNWAYTAAKAKEQCMITPADPIKSNTIEDVSGANDTIESANSKKILFCSKCGQKLMAGAEFCHKCGAQTIRERKPTICPNCKKELTKDNVFCHHCGQRVLNE